MFETQVLDDVSRLQAQMAQLRRKYGQFCPNELQTALRTAHEALDTAVDTAKDIIQAKQQQGTEQQV